MKKLSCSIALFCLMVVAFQANAQIRFGIKGGLNFANQTVRAAGSSVTTNSQTGYHLGVVGEIGLFNIIAIQPGLSLSKKGSELDLGAGVKSTLSPLYLEIPVNLMYKLELFGIGVYGAVGPYYAIGIGGKAKTEGPIIGTDEEDIKFGSDTDDTMKKTDFGINIGVGAELRSFNVGLTYGLGLSNARPKGDIDNCCYNRVLMLSVGYFF